MNRQRIISHVFMWSLVLAGDILALYTIPSKFMATGNLRFGLYIIAALLGVEMGHNIARSIISHFRLRSGEKTEKKLAGSGIYAGFVHPTCTTLVILSWIFFFVFPDLRFLIANIWLTFVVVLWIRIEESIYQKIPPTKESEEEREEGEEGPD